MKPCRRYAELISRHLDGDLNAREQEALTAHLARCCRCTAVFNAYKAIRAALRISYDRDIRAEPLCLSSFAWRRLAAVFLAVIGIGLAFFVAGHARQARQPAIAFMVNALSPSFASPLGSLIYYEEIAQKAVTLHDAAAQSHPFEAQLGRENDLALSFCYQSPLFGDGGLLCSHYKTLTGCMTSSE